MSVLRGASLAALMTIAFSGEGAAACDDSWRSWFVRCEPEFAPMIVPPFDVERGPVWTNNGWSHPQPLILVEPYPHAPPAPVRPEAPWRPHGESRPLK